MQNPFNQTIRKTCQSIRRQLSLDFQRTASNKICQSISLSEKYQHAKHIALYHAANGEVCLSSLLHLALLHEKLCYFPVMNDNLTLSFLPITNKSSFTPNLYGILEPNIALTKAFPPNNIDIIFTPLVAFDPAGTRLGMGMGYYDRTLAASRPQLLMGVAYEFQHYPYIEPQPWDIPLDAVTTEKSIYWSQK